MKKCELSSFVSKLEQCKKLKSIKIAYAIMKNIELAEQEFKKILVEIPLLEKYETERINLCVKHAIKDDQGRPKVKYAGKGQEFDIANPDAFNAEFATLQEQYRDTLDKWNSEVSFSLHKVDVKWLPEDTSAEDINNLVDILTEDSKDAHY